MSLIPPQASKASPKPRLVSLHIPEHIAELDEIARKLDCSRHHVVKHLLLAGLEAYRKEKARGGR